MTSGNFMPLPITDIISKIKSNNTNLGITLYDKVSFEYISHFEKTKGVYLPDDLKMFYSFSNGFETSEDMFRIIPLQEILQNKHDNYTIGQNDFHIAEYMIYCDMWTITISPNDNNEYSIYNKANSTVILTNSFANFLDKFLTGGVFDGLYKWREEIEKTT